MCIWYDHYSKIIIIIIKSLCVCVQRVPWPLKAAKQTNRCLGSSVTE